MAYCNECGAYIPDGHTKCLACGLDTAEAAKRETQEAKQAQAYEYKYEEPKRTDTDWLKQELERQRKRQQENSRKWAETEKAQRERAQNRNSSYTGSTRSTDTKKYSAPSGFDASKLFSLLSYFGILFVLPYILCKDDGFALFHAKQGMILFLASLIAKIAASILGLSWLVSLAKIYFIYKGVTNVLNGKREMLPYIGSLI